MPAQSLPPISQHIAEKSRFCLSLAASTCGQAVLALCAHEQKTKAWSNASNPMQTGLALHCAARNALLKAGCAWNSNPEHSLPIGMDQEGFCFPTLERFSAPEGFGIFEGLFCTRRAMAHLPAISLPKGCRFAVFEFGEHLEDSIYLKLAEKSLELRNEAYCYNEAEEFGKNIQAPPVSTIPLWL